MARSFRAESGEWVWLDDHQYQIRAIAGGADVRLISPTAPADRQILTLPLAMLLSDPTFRPCTADEDPSLDDEATQVQRALRAFEPSINSLRKFHNLRNSLPALVLSSITPVLSKQLKTNMVSDRCSILHPQFALFSGQP